MMFGSSKVKNIVETLFNKREKDLKIPKFPKPEETSSSSQKNQPTKNSSENPPLSNTKNNEKKTENNDIKNKKDNFIQEVYEKPVVVLKNLEATVDLNKDETLVRPVEKFLTPSFTTLNSGISLDLDGFKLNPGEMGEDEKDIHLNDDLNQQVSTNLLFLKSVNQMNFDKNRQLKMDFEIKYEKTNISSKKKVEIIDYVLIKRGYLENPYYIYRISSTIDNQNAVIVERRYSDFEWLHTYLLNHPKYQGLLIPKLPDKHGIGGSFWNYLGTDVEFIKKRKNV